MRTLLATLTLVACFPSAVVRHGSPASGEPIASFYCDALSQCWTSESECPQCRRNERAWCAVYATGEDTHPKRLMCGVGRRNCQELANGLGGPYAHDRGECVERTAMER